MAGKVLLITPPFTQLNTPYPATAYLKGFLKTKQVPCDQMDLGIEVITNLFSANGLKQLFVAEIIPSKLSENGARIKALSSDYITCIDPVIAFLLDKNPTLAHLICNEDFLPEAARFDQLEDLDWAFGTMGSRDKARHLATLFLEDISDYIIEAVDPHFGFSRYAERLGLSANSFNELYRELNLSPTYVDDLAWSILDKRLADFRPHLVCFSIPFPGNLYSALRCSALIKKYYPKIKIAIGGGYPNTELRSLTDARLFEFIDFITLDDGEAPIYHLLEYLQNERKLVDLKRTFSLHEGKVTYHNESRLPDYSQKEVGTPDYDGLPLDKYLSVIEIANPMHRMWSDGRWNKLTLAHGCYWGKCTFCDISLDYIKIYEPITAKLVCDRIEEIIAQTGQNGFHFVDEAAPPALMREVALEILRRGLTVVWWTNIRFEKSFSSDLCLLLKASGCIAVSGGLEVASNRLLEMIDKGVSVEQVARVTDNFTQAGIMVHAYLMYGYPTQTNQETIDALEVVRQLFENGIVQSGFWHRFAMTAHSPVGLEPERFNVAKQGPLAGGFANNDLQHTDPSGGDHELFGEGLRKSLFNYMHGVCFEFSLQEWFNHKVPITTIPSNYISRIIGEQITFSLQPITKLVWLGNVPTLSYYETKKKGKPIEMVALTIHNKRESVTVKYNKEIGLWLANQLEEMSVKEGKAIAFKSFEGSFPTSASNDIDNFLTSAGFQDLKSNGLLLL